MILMPAAITMESMTDTADRDTVVNTAAGIAAVIEEILLEEDKLYDVSGW